jgi:hypothetical protein
VRLWTLIGWPVRSIRFAIIRDVEGGRRVPDATNIGAVEYLYSEQETSAVSKDERMLSEGAQVIN